MTQGRPAFGDETLIKKRRYLKVVTEETKPPKKIERPCKFQVFVPGLDGYNRSKPCPNEAQGNGWCSEHQHAQSGMDIGASLGYPEMEISVVYVIIGQGRDNWQAYFERAVGHGLQIVMRYLEAQV